MPILRNPRHERFAQALARGIEAQEAYKSAGFKAHTSNPYRLAQKSGIRARVSELLAKTQAIEERATARAIERTAISRERVIEMLLEDRELARKEGQAAAAVSATKLIGMELHRMFVDRKEVRKVDEFDRMDTEELRRYIRTLVDDPADPKSGTKH